MKNRNGENLKLREITKKTVCIISAVALATAGLTTHKEEASASDAVSEHSVRSMEEINDISFDETVNNVENPGMGFYSTVYMNLTENGDNRNDSIGSGLRHFRVDISHFSPYYREQEGLDSLSDYHISSKALDALRAKLQKARDKNLTVVIRFAYDPGFSTYTSYEPEKVIKDNGNEYRICDTTLINEHQEDLSKVLHEYKDVVVALEAGLIGPWGEMHSSEKCSYDYDYNKHKLVESPVHYNKIISKWLELLEDTEISVLIRKMEDYVNFANANGYKINKISNSNVGENIPTKNMKEYRIGFFDDSYLASSTDKGTFEGYENRATGIKWLKSQTKHVLFGGEMTAWDSKEKERHPDLKRFNTLSYITKEAFDTHTSYLNVGYEKAALDQLKGNPNSSDPLMQDDADAGNYDSNYEGQNGYVYFRNHLGYRYVVRNVKLTKETTNYENFGMEAKIENVGFANIVRSKKLKLIMEGSNGNTFEYPLSKLDSSKNEKVVNGNVLNWLSDDKATKVNEGMTTFKVNVDLDDDMPNDTYKVYLRVADSDDLSGLKGYPVRFANKGKNADKADSSDKGIYNETLGANYLGNFTVVDQSTIAKKTDDKESNSGSSKTDSKKNKTQKVKVVKKDKIVAGKEFTISFANNRLKVKVVSVKGKSVKLKAVKILKNGKYIIIPGTFKSNGYTYKITEIGSKAFYKCNAKSVTIGKYIRKIGKKAFYGMKKCKVLIIRSKKLKKKTVGKKAFAKMNKKIKVKTYSKKIKKYKKLLKKRGLSKKALYKKLK